MNDGRGDNLELTDDDMLVGDEEEVFTTPARLLAAVELAIKEANAGVTTSRLWRSYDLFVPRWLSDATFSTEK